MSRCFPFPPPGYEKKIPSTHSHLLKKEKHREKKHKKEKKDKEKKEKDKDKKDRKEKRRDKKKEKGRNKPQQSDNQNTSAETGHKVQPQWHNEQNVIQKNSDTYIPPDDQTVTGRIVGFNEGYNGCDLSLSDEPNGAEFVHCAERVVKEDAERGGGQMIHEKITPIHHKRNEGGGIFYHNSHLANNFEDSNLAFDLDRRLKNEAEQPYVQNQTANSLIGSNRKGDGGVVKSVSSHVVKKIDKRIVGSNGGYVGDKSVEGTLAPYVSGLGQGNHDRMPRQSLDSGIEKKIEARERINLQEDNLQQQGKKRKDRNGDMMSHEKQKNREKERNEIKVNRRGNQKIAEQDTQDNHKMDMLCPPNKEMLHSAQYSINKPAIDEKLNQAKGHLTNGISHVTGFSVLSRPLHNENGREAAPYQMLVRPSPGVQRANSNIKIDRVGKINGIIGTQVQHPTTEQVIQPRLRSPNPDVKRFIDILAIPKVEELSEIDNSDWLISSREKPEKKDKVDDPRNSTSADMPQVWSKATIIKSADVCALPYVIPY